jgi:hypothetical protein
MPQQPSSSLCLGSAKEQARRGETRRVQRRKARGEHISRCGSTLVME